ncbi:addiction module protein [Nannocystis sp. ILAH1]|uniref:addiction module protein n=1 Tax=unclassified Nannocystis TaxID=2627009 RepID=UPI00227183D2|nr:MULTISPECIES: addiction module protein [unclassified Nannocystis]MCY0988798.1 addiction module protein [Nannocystis sp. ILAH1]MCY1072775.1 addiction module protein [Nannocystis sp. RBIL2]
MRSLVEPEPGENELAESEAAWEEEVLRIAKEHEEGRAESIPWEQVRAQMFGERS